MMEEELRLFLRERGWNLSRRKRGGKEYFYAQKWRCGDAYLCPVTKVGKITKDYVLEKLAKAL